MSVGQRQTCQDSCIEVEDFNEVEEFQALSHSLSLMYLTKQHLQCRGMVYADQLCLPREFSAEGD